MNYTESTKNVTIDADEFVKRYRDVERIADRCNGCPSYGNSWACPPFEVDPARLSDGFSEVLLIGTVIEFDDKTCEACKGARNKSKQVADQALREVWDKLLPRLYELERQVPGSRCFTFRCRLCPDGCTRPDGLPCRHPELLRHSLEAVGFDVGAAARDLMGIDLEWSKDGSLQQRLTLITAVMRP